MTAGNGHATPPRATADGTDLELSIVMPCLNEVDSVGACIAKASGFLARSGVRGEIIVADNGSTDGSIELAESLGAHVVQVPRRGYGAALAGGFKAAHGRFLIMGDADDTYNFSDLAPFLHSLRNGADLVIGNRFRGGIEPGAMPALHRYVGNPGLTWLARFLFKTACGDVYCGLRGVTRPALERLQLQSRGMEYALEMVAKAARLGMTIAEVPTTLAPGRRTREPHLRTWNDGRRSLRTYMLFSPEWLFLYPGVLMMVAGTIASGWLLGTASVTRGLLNLHPLLYSIGLIPLGFQAVCFHLFTKVIAVSGHHTPVDPLLERLVTRVRVYHGLVGALVLAMLGLAGAAYTVSVWERGLLDDIESLRMMRLGMLSMLALTLGSQTALASVFLSLLKVQFLETGTHQSTAGDAAAAAADGRRAER